MRSVPEWGCFSPHSLGSTALMAMEHDLSNTQGQGAFTKEVGWILRRCATNKGPQTIFNYFWLLESLIPEKAAEAAAVHIEAWAPSSSSLCHAKPRGHLPCACPHFAQPAVPFHHCVLQKACLDEAHTIPFSAFLSDCLTASELTCPLVSLMLVPLSAPEKILHWKSREWCVSSVPGNVHRLDR